MRFFLHLINLLAILLLLLLLSSFINPTTSYDPKKPPSPVKDVCNRVKSAKRRYCIAVFNTGSVENADMKFLAYYTRDFAENNATIAMQRINSELMPRLPDPYIQEVLSVCQDAFKNVRDELVGRVNPMITTRSDFREAKAWVSYGIGLMYSCREVCMGSNNNNNNNNNPSIICPLTKNIEDTQDVLKLLYVVLDLLTQGYI